ncbi:MAG: VCBS repeat-containing protein [Akkermansiaceae bacterium]|nr:VCBS repeat-containing protein [Akkermansiaceae bacterium]
MTPRRLPSITPLLLLGALCAFVLETQAQSPGDAAFQRLDKNQDGKISRDEAPSADSFTAADADKNGAVTPEEFRRYLTARQRPQTPNPAPAPSATTQAQTPPPVDGKPVLKSLPDSDAVRDAAGTGQHFECVHVPGLTDTRKGVNGFAIADLNRDGFPDFIVTVSPPVSLPGVGAGETTGNVQRSSRRTAIDQLLVLINEGGFRFREHRIEIRGSALTQENFAGRAQVPNLADFNGDGFLDLFITRHSPVSAGENRGNLPLLGNTFLVSDGAWDRFVDVSAKMGTRNEQAYNRQSSIGDVNGDGWLDIAIGCDNIGNAMGGLPHSRLYVFKPNGAKFEDGQFEDIGGSDLIPDFGGFYHDSAKDKAGPNLALRDVDGDGDLDLLQSCHIDLREPLLPYSPGEYRQGVFCWKNLFRETGENRFEKITGNGLAVEARLKYDREKQVYVPQGKAPGLPYLFFADVDNDGLQDALATGPSDMGWSPRCEDVGGRYWKNLGGFRFEERTEAAGLAALNWSYRQWHEFFAQLMSERHRQWRPLSGTKSQPGVPSQHPLENRPYYADGIFGDFDNDGWLDLVVLDRRENPYLQTRAMLWMNRGDGTFEVKPTEFSGLDSGGISGEASDMNGDGLLDLFFAADPDNTGVALDIARYDSKVYWNTGEHGAKANHWLHLTFTGLQDAELIGAKIELTANGKKQYRWIHSNHSYKSGGALDAHFGLGKATSAEVKVTLLNGKSKSFASVAADKSHALDVGH